MQNIFGEGAERESFRLQFSWSPRQRRPRESFSPLASFEGEPISNHSVSRFASEARNRRSRVRSPRLVRDSATLQAKAFPSLRSTTVAQQALLSPSQAMSARVGL